MQVITTTRVPTAFPAIDFVYAARAGSEQRRLATPSITQIRSIAIVAEQALSGDKSVRDTRRGRVIQATRAAAEIAAWKLGNAIAADAKLTAADEASAADAVELLEIVSTISHAEGDLAAESEWQELADYCKQHILRPVWLARLAA